MKLTADTITDDQIRDLRKSQDWSTWWHREFAIALGETTTVNDPIGDLRAARLLFADVLNARKAQ